MAASGVDPDALEVLRTINPDVDAEVPANASPLTTIERAARRPCSASTRATCRRLLKRCWRKAPELLAAGGLTPHSRAPHARCPAPSRTIMHTAALSADHSAHAFSPTLRPAPAQDARARNARRRCCAGQSRAARLPAEHARGPSGSGSLERRLVDGGQLEVGAEAWAGAVRLTVRGRAR
jgi:hypothetical protein